MFLIKKSLYYMLFDKNNYINYRIINQYRLLLISYYHTHNDILDTKYFILTDSSIMSILYLFVKDLINCKF